MKPILNHLFEYKQFSRQEAKQILTDIANNQYNEMEITAFMTAYIMRGISVAELTGFRDALLELCIQVDLSEFNPIDLCGTGGDGKNTFNISTLSSFVVAAAGGKVAKHGNYGVSSVSGSSNVMEYFGYKFTNDIAILRKQIETVGLCFMHAPLFHPALKTVAPIRKKLGIKTFFNMLGPMVNPAFPKNQLVGVFSLELAKLYEYLYQKTDKNFMILYSLDGYDEISLTGNFMMISNEGEKLLTPKDLGLQTVKAEEIFGGDTVEESARIFLTILEGNGTKAQNDVLLANSAMALKCITPEKTLETCLAEANEALLSKKALASFKNLLAL